MTRFFVQFPPHFIYVTDYLHYYTYTHRRTKDLPHRSKDGANVIHSLCLYECFYFFARREIGSVFSTFSFPRILGIKRIGFSFLFAALLIGFLTSIRFFQSSSFLHRHAHTERVRQKIMGGFDCQTAVLKQTDKASCDARLSATKAFADALRKGDQSAIELFATDSEALTAILTNCMGQKFTRCVQSLARVTGNSGENGERTRGVELRGRVDSSDGFVEQSRDDRR